MMLKQRAKKKIKGSKIGLIILITFILAAQIPLSAQYKETKHKVKVLYKNGKMKEKGQTCYMKKVGIWNYYTEMGRHDHKEKWKDGKMRWAIYYTPKHRKAKTINSKGDTTYFKDCGCTP